MEKINEVIFDALKKEYGESYVNLEVYDNDVIYVEDEDRNTGWRVTIQMMN